jgi:hypothetical protein
MRRSGRIWRGDEEWRRVWRGGGGNDVGERRGRETRARDVSERRERETWMWMDRRSSYRHACRCRCSRTMNV